MLITIMTITKAMVILGDITDSYDPSANNDTFGVKCIIDYLWILFILELSLTLTSIISLSSLI